MGWRLAVDFGTSFTTAAVAPDRGMTADAGGGRAEVLEIDNSRYLPSAVFLDEDGALVVGRVALSRGAVFPERLERVPKRALVRGDAVRLSGTTVPVARLVAAVLSRVATEARTRCGGTPGVLVVTHPARWGSRELGVLAEAARSVSLPAPTFVPEPVAAARHYVDGHAVPIGGCVAVYDLGGGTLDTAVLRREAEGFRLVGAPGGNLNLGGLDFDDALLRVVARHAKALDAQAWEGIWSAEDGAGHRARALWRAAVVMHRELLSSAAATIVAEVGFEQGVRVTRGEFEAAVENLVHGSVYELRSTIDRAGTPMSDIAAIYLTGGASRTPLVSDLIHTSTGILPTTSSDPKAAVVLGALRHAAPATGSAVGITPEVRHGPAGRDGTSATDVSVAPPAAIHPPVSPEPQPQKPRPRAWRVRPAWTIARARRLWLLSNSINGIAFSPDGGLIAAAGDDTKVRFWNTTSLEPAGNPLTTTHAGQLGVQGVVVFSPDGRLIATAGNDGTVRLWNATTRQPVGNPFTGQAGTVRAVAFSPDGGLLATAEPDRTLRLWSTTAREPVGKPLFGHTGWLRALAFSPDGRILASAGADGSIRGWAIDPVVEFDR